MGITEISILHHMGIVLLLLWLLSYLNRCHPVTYVMCLIYLYLVHERYVMRLKKKLQHEEKKQSNQRRVLTDSESVRWLNHAIEKIWPICMEQICSQKMLLPIIPWFLEKYKPWTAKKAEVQHMYLGRNPPQFTEMRVLRQSTDDDHLVLELGMNFLTADDMSGILAVKLRKRMGFGMWAKLHVTGMHVEGKVLIGVKFIRHWPFLGRLRVCFAEPPYFQMTVKPIFTHGLNVTEVPGIAGWLDKLLSNAFEETLVQPNMLVVDVEKFASPQPETWFSVDVKEPVAYAKVEVVEGADMKPSDSNGLADPYVKGQLGPYRFRTQTQKKTLSPKWHEEFKIPICTWESPNSLVIEVCDKDHFVDDSLGDCTVNINDLRNGQRHDMWLPLQNIKMGRLHLAISVLEVNAKDGDSPCDGEPLNKEERRNSIASETVHKGSFSSVSPENSTKVADDFEPINVEGQHETGIWVHHPGSEVAHTWKPRKGKSRQPDTQIHRVPNDSCGSTRSAASGYLNNESSSTDENPDGKNPINAVQRGMQRISAVFHRSPKKEDHSGNIAEPVLSPYANVKAVNKKVISVKFMPEDSPSGLSSGKVSKDGSLSPEGSGPESPSKGNMKDMAKSILKHAGNSARSIKHALSRKGSRRSRAGAPVVTEREIYAESDSSDDESLSSTPEKIPVVSHPISSYCGNGDNYDTKEHIVQIGSTSTDPGMNTGGHTEKVNIEGLEKMDDDEVSSSDRLGNGLIESLPPKLAEENFEGEKRENFEGEKRENLEGENKENMT